MGEAIVRPPSEEAWEKAISGDTADSVKAILERLHQSPGKGVSVEELVKLDPTFGPERANAINNMLRMRKLPFRLVPTRRTPWEKQKIALAAI
ncbi:MAG TPA: hypothetical protein VJJ27_01410 [Candidatus Paceibacterota bacterium]